MLASYFNILSYILNQMFLEVDNRPGNKALNLEGKLQKIYATEVISKKRDLLKSESKYTFTF